MSSGELLRYDVGSVIEAFKASRLKGWACSTSGFWAENRIYRFDVSVYSMRLWKL